MALSGQITHANPPAPTDAVVARSLNLKAYYPDRDAALSELSSVERQTSTIQLNDHGRLYEYTKIIDGLLNRLRRVGVYFNISQSRDLDDLAASSAADRVDQCRRKLLGDLESAFHAATPAQRASLTRANGRYTYLIDKLTSQKQHASQDVTKLVATLSDPALESFWKVYQRVDQLPAGQGASISAASDGKARAEREAEWRAGWAAANTKADAKAAILFGVIHQGEAAARLQGYGDAASAGYDSRGLTTSMVASALSAVENNIGLYQRYWSWRMDRIRTLTGITDPQPWDLAVLKTGSVSRFSFDDARQIIHGVLQPLGTDYVEHFDSLLAPSSGRVDIASTLGRREAGGYSVNAPGVPAGLYIARYTGTLDNVRVVIHEGGHAVAAQYANEGQTPPELMKGPNWLMESYAIFNQILLYRYLADHSASIADRDYYQSALVDDLMFQIFGSAEESSMEEDIYSGVAAGKVQSAGDLSTVSLGVMRTYEPWSADILKQSSLVWSKKQLFYQDPFYLVNYLYAGMIAASLYREMTTHPDTFPARYRALLKRGYDAPPMELLATVLGRDTSAATLTASAFAVLDQEMKRLPKAGAASH